MELSIAKEKYEYLSEVKEKLNYGKWVLFIEINKKYYEWLENTKRGNDLLANIDKIPVGSQARALEVLNKCSAYADKSKKGWYGMIVDFHKDVGVIKISFMKKITRKHIEQLLNMATYLDAYLLNNKKEIIDNEFLNANKELLYFQ